MSKKSKKVVQTEIPNKIQNLINALCEVGYNISVAEKDYAMCIDGKIHGYGITITINDIFDGDGNEYELMFDQSGKIIDTFLDLPIIKR